MHAIIITTQSVVPISQSTTNEHGTITENNYLVTSGNVINVNHRGLGSRPPDFGMEVVGFPRNIITSYNVQKYEMGKLSKVETFQK